MKIAIHHSKNSFSERWIPYCDSNSISYKIVDCYRSDIMQQLEDCDALMWHFNHKGSKESKFAKQIIRELNRSVYQGIQVEAEENYEFAGNDYRDRNKGPRGKRKKR